MRAADRAAAERLGAAEPPAHGERRARRRRDRRARRQRRLARARGPVVVVSGAGANGGDGFVVARHLARRGVDVRVLLAAPRARVAGDAAVMLGALERMGGVPVEDGEGWTDEAAWRARLAGAGVVVDAIFGIGLRDDVTGVPAAALAAMNAAAAYKVAVDIPSGLDADTGRVHGVAFRADVTVTMGARKLGLVLDAAAPVGDVEVVDLGVPLDAAVAGPLVRWIEGGADLRASSRGAARRRTRAAAGHLLVIAGSEGKTGAALLAGRAALRAGAGLVTLASTARGQAALDAKVVEIMTARYTDGDDADARESATMLASLAGRMNAVALGPGIPTGPNMRAVVRDLASRLAAARWCSTPTRSTCSARRSCASSASRPRRASSRRTRARWRASSGRRIDEIEADRLGAARDLAGARQGRRRAQGRAHARRGARRHGLRQPDGDGRARDRRERRRPDGAHRLAARAGDGAARGGARRRLHSRRRGRGAGRAARLGGHGGRSARRDRRRHSVAAGVQFARAVQRGFGHA